MSRPSYPSERKVAEGKYLKIKFSQTKVFEARLTRARLAAELGVSGSVFSQWVVGSTRIPDKHWLHLARRLRFNALELRPELVSAYVSMSGLDLAMRLDALSPGQKGLVLRFIEMIMDVDI